MRTFSKSLMLVLIVTALLAFAPLTTTQATVGDSGQDRWVSLETSDENRTSTINMTAPESISENHTFSGDLTYNHTTGGDGNWYTAPTVTHWINLTFSNDTWTSSTFTSGGIELSSNNTVTYEVDTNVSKGDYNLSVEFADDTGGSAIENGLAITVLDNTNYMLQFTLVQLITAIIPIVVLVAVVIPMIMSLFDGFEDDLGSF